MRQDSLLSPYYLFNIVLEVQARATRKHKEIQAILIRMEEIKLSLFADNVIVYINDLKNSTRDLLTPAANLTIKLEKGSLGYFIKEGTLTEEVGKHSVLQSISSLQEKV